MLIIVIAVVGTLLVGHWALIRWLSGRDCYEPAPGAHWAEIISRHTL